MEPESLAIAHKDYDVRGGGEVFVRRLANLFGAPVYVGRRNHSNEPDDNELDIREIPLSRLDKWAIDGYGIKRTAAYALQWQAAADQLADYDVVITSGNEPLWYVGPDEQTVIAYTHSTPRYMYDLYPETRDFSGIMGRIGSLFYTAQRVVYESNVRRPDHWIANSDLVARRMLKYWNLRDDQVDVVYPPVDVHSYSPTDKPTGDYYLHLGRIAGHKRVGDLVDAWEGLGDRRLVIAGTGPERDELEQRAPKTVEFVGFVDEDRKRELYAGAKALLYPCMNEDFGMVPIEAMAAGTPVIGVREGFTKYQVLEGKNGYLADRDADSGWLDAVNQLERDGVAWADHEIAAFTERFSLSQFREGMHEAIETAVDRASVNVPWGDEDQPEIAAGVKTAADLIADGEG